MIILFRIAAKIAKRFRNSYVLKINKARMSFVIG